MFKNVKFVDYVKWLATIIQLIGYGMTGLNYVPYNVYLFFVGIFLWFSVGGMRCSLFEVGNWEGYSGSRMEDSASLQPS